MILHVQFEGTYIKYTFDFSNFEALLTNEIQSQQLCILVEFDKNIKLCMEIIDI